MIILFISFTGNFEQYQCACVCVPFLNAVVYKKENLIDFFLSIVLFYFFPFSNKAVFNDSSIIVSYFLSMNQRTNIQCGKIDKTIYSRAHQEKDEPCIYPR